MGRKGCGGMEGEWGKGVGEERGVGEGKGQKGVSSFDIFVQYRMLGYKESNGLC